MEPFAGGSLGTHKKESKKTKRSRANQKGSSRNAKQKMREQSTNKDIQSIKKIATDNDKRSKGNVKQKVRKRSHNKEMQP